MTCAEDGGSLEEIVSYSQRVERPAGVDADLCQSVRRQADALDELFAFPHLRCGDRVTAPDSKSYGAISPRRIVTCVVNKQDRTRMGAEGFTGRAEPRAWRATGSPTPTSARVCSSVPAQEPGRGRPREGRPHCVSVGSADSVGARELFQLAHINGVGHGEEACTVRM